MAILGLGTDIIAIERMKKAQARTPGLAKRILTPNEYEIFCEHKKPVAFLAKRFAIKEATVKALGTGFTQGISFHHIQVEHDPHGKPILKLFAEANQQAVKLGVNHIHLSVSDEIEYACATVILEA